MSRFSIGALGALFIIPAMAEDSFFYISAAGLRSHQRFTDIQVNIIDTATGNWTNLPNPNLADNVLGASLAIGYGAGNFRGEIDLTMRGKAHVNNATIKSDSLTVNLFYDFNNNTRITPFVGVGAGVSQARLHIENLDLSSTKTNFAAMGIIGVSLYVTYDFRLNLSYRYARLGHVALRHEVGGGEILDVRARNTGSEFLLGASYRF